MDNTNTSNTKNGFRAVWVIDGKRLGKGKPSADVKARRKQVLVPIGQEYDPKRDTQEVSAVV